MTKSTTLADRLRSAITAAGISQHLLETEAKLPRGYASRLLNGERKRLGADMLLRIAKVLNVNAIWLATGEGEQPIIVDPEERSQPVPVAHGRVVVRDDHEHVLEQAYEHGRHTLRAAEAVRRILAEQAFLVDDDADPVAMVAEWLDAAVRLQRRGDAVTPSTIMRELTRKIVSRDQGVESMNSALREQYREATGRDAPTETPPSEVEEAQLRAIKREWSESPRVSGNEPSSTPKGKR